jgi:5-methyltetrahydropteroyltriglutamate--homocysteine methyltransferase
MGVGPHADGSRCGARDATALLLRAPLPLFQVAPAEWRNPAMTATSVHVDHVGSLLRPAELKEQRFKLLGVHDADHNLGAHTNIELKKIEDQYIREVVKFQEACGLPVVTDGDFRRRSWWTDFLLSFTGLSISYDGKTPITMINAAGEKRPIAGIKVTSKISPRDSGATASFKFLKSITNRMTKVTIPGPPIVHFLRDTDFVPDVYADVDGFWHDLIAAYRVEIRKLADAGCRYIQIDECMLPYLCDPRHREMSKLRGDDPDKLIETYAWSINEVVADKSKDMTVAVHMCRGNMNAFWGAAGGYESIAEISFGMPNVDMFLLEYDTPRAGDFAPLHHAGKDKKILLGIMSTKDPKLEGRDDIKRRIDDAAKHIDLEQLGLCPQCGFSTNVFGTEFTVDDERRKIERMVDISRDVWGTS